MFSRKVKTEKLIKDSADNIYSAEGIFFRDETIITSHNSGTVNYNYADGDKIKSGCVVGLTFSGINDIDIKSQILDIDEKIASLTESLSVGDIYLSDAVNLENQINDVVLDIMSIGESKDISLYKNLVGRFQVLINKKQTILGNTHDFEEQINSLKEAREMLISSQGGAVYQEIAPVSGYFVSDYDGYENLITPDNLKSKTYEDFKAVMDLDSGSERPQNYVGKILGDYDWYFACTVNSKTFSNFNQGDSIYLSFPSVAEKYINAKIERIESIDDENSFVIFSSDFYDKEIFTLRKSKVNIVLKTYNGFKVNKDAIRMNGDETGIYILTGAQIQFKPVNVLFAKDNYVIITADSDKNVSLIPGELVVIDGKNLFDGKMVR